MLNKENKRNNNPKVSEGSQFHHPPQVPSWTAHQLPRKSAVNDTSKIGTWSELSWFNCRIKKNCVDSNFWSIHILKRLKTRNVPE